LATHSIRPTNNSCNHKGRTAKSEDQASGLVRLQHVHLLPWEHEEYLAHIVAVLCIIKQKGLDSQCRKLRKAVVKLTGMLKDLLKASESKNTVSLEDDVEAHKLEIKETQKMLQGARSSTTRQLPKRTSYQGTSCPVIRSLIGIAFPGRCMSMTCGLE
jgi:hypothetical protein